ncbi:(Fe-S)-binding protein, partial [Bullifex sp.]|uniref:(Fe-S)-binding protein n=1 Tax=Bullifex sp. TaxID=2815808 RepID=UPI002A7F939B
RDALALSGVNEIHDVLAQGSANDPFLELLGCEGGCINGPVSDKSKSLAARKNAIAQFTEERINSGEKLFEPKEEFIREVLDKGYGIINSAQPKSNITFNKVFSEDEIRQALLELGKNTKADELNCGGCGYNTCRDMAVAYLSGMAEAEMCVTKMRKEAQSKVDMLLRTIPNAVVIVNRDLNIADCNINFLKIFGDMDESLLDDSMLSLVSGLPLERFVPFYEKFSDEFYAQKRNQYRLHYKDKFLRVTFFLVEKNRLLGAMFDDITSPTVKRETVVKKAEDVIQKSLETVQQIASLLGENAAETEIMLNSLIDAFSVHGDSNNDGFTIDDEVEV